MKFRSLFVATISLPIMALASMPASAVNTNVYNGSYCKAYHGSQSADLRHQSGGIRNIHPTAIRAITCPVLHDEAFGPQGAKVYVYWVAQKAKDALTCTVYSLDTTGAIVVATDTDTKIGTGWLPPDNGILPQPYLDIAADDASYNMICNLPAGGRVASIQVDENE